MSAAEAIVSAVLVASDPRRIRAQGAHAAMQLLQELAPEQAQAIAGSVLLKNAAQVAQTAQAALGTAQKVLGGAQAALGELAQVTGDARLTQAAGLLGHLGGAAGTAAGLLGQGKSLVDTLTDPSAYSAPAGLPGSTLLGAALRAAQSVAGRSRDPRLRAAASLIGTATSLVTGLASGKGQLSSSLSFVLNVTQAFLGQVTGAQGGAAAGLTSGARQQFAADMRWLSQSLRTAQKLGGGA